MGRRLFWSNGPLVRCPAYYRNDSGPALAEYRKCYMYIDEETVGLWVGSWVWWVRGLITTSAYRWHIIRPAQRCRRSIFGLEVSCLFEAGYFRNWTCNFSPRNTGTAMEVGISPQRVENIVRKIHKTTTSSWWSISKYPLFAHGLTENHDWATLVGKTVHSYMYSYGSLHTSALLCQWPQRALHRGCGAVKCWTPVTVKKYKGWT